jgi:Histidinol-phosphate/aromatic aminotransferase and cobyric acid decarboxylase
LEDFLSNKARGIAPYTAGAQPQEANIIKLNTNENPYPPSPGALLAYSGFDASRLRLYPRPDGGDFRSAAAALSGLPESHVFCGNGSDEVLGFAFLAFFDGNILFPDITYSFYPVWAALYNISYTLLPLNNNFTIPVDRLRAQGGVVLANPNAPTGIALPPESIEAVLKNNAHCVVIVDEAYSAFGAGSADSLVKKYPNLLVVHTLSKSHALAGLRVAYALGQPHLISGLERVKDSFNSYPLDAAAQCVAAAALRDTQYYENITRKIIATREAASARLIESGFDVPPSSANFIFAGNKKGVDASSLKDWLELSHIYVRHFNRPRIAQYLRISVGTDGQMEKLIARIAAFPG